MYKVVSQFESLGVSSGSSEGSSEVDIDAEEDYGPEGYCPIDIGKLLHGNRYEILRKLGYGMYSTVWLAWDRRDQKLVAIKVLTGSPVLAPVGEVRAYKQLKPSLQNVTPLLGSFTIPGYPSFHHECLVSEVMGESCDSVIRNPQNYGVANPAKSFCAPTCQFWVVKHFLRGLSSGVDELHSCSVIHADLSLDNTLLSVHGLQDVSSEYLKQQVPGQTGDSFRCHGPRHPNYRLRSMPLTKFVDTNQRTMTVKVSDLGGAQVGSVSKRRLVTPYARRPPEVILGIHCDHKIDVWALGCLVYETLYRGSLFDVDEECESSQQRIDDSMTRFVDCLGPPPRSIKDKWPNYKRYYNSSGIKIRSDITSNPRPGGGVYVFPTLEQSFHRNGLEHVSEAALARLTRLAKRMLAWEASQRPEASEVARELELL